MDHHEIRLRGGWECDAADGVGPAARLTLPVRPCSLPAGELRLTRRFHRPPRLTEEPVVLRLRHVPGIQSVVLNGLPLGPISPERFEFDLPCGTLAPRNELVILARPGGGDDEWGVISLVFGGPAAPADGAELAAPPR